MKSRPPAVRGNNKYGAAILFANAQAYIEDILATIKEFNAIRDALAELGYVGTADCADAEIPVLELIGNVGGYINIESADVLDEYWQVGPRLKAGPILASRGRQAQQATREKDRLGAERGWRCHYCAQEGTNQFGPDMRVWHVDHSYPVIRGGDSSKDNLVLACATCNLQKHAMFSY